MWPVDYGVQRVSQCMLVWPTIYHVKMDGANNPHMNRNYRTSPYQDKLAYLACWPMRRERVPLVWRRSLRTPQPILPSAYCMPDNYSLTSRASSVIVIERTEFRPTRPITKYACLSLFLIIGYKTCLFHPCIQIYALACPK